MSFQKSVPVDTRYVPPTQQPYCCVPTCIQMVMLRHGIPLAPAEQIGYEMGLVVPPLARDLFWKSRSGDRPAAGWGTQAGKPSYGPNAVFRKLGIPLKMSWRLINKFKTEEKLRDYLKSAVAQDLDVLICFDYGELYQTGPQGGHVCVLDRYDSKTDQVRMIDPEANVPKSRSVDLNGLYRAMVKHTKENSAGCWEFGLITN